MFRSLKFILKSFYRSFSCTLCTTMPTMPWPFRVPAYSYGSELVSIVLYVTVYTYVYHQRGLNVLRLHLVANRYFPSFPVWPRRDTVTTRVWTWSRPWRYLFFLNYLQSSDTVTTGWSPIFSICLDHLHIKYSISNFQYKIFGHDWTTSTVVYKY